MRNTGSLVITRSIRWSKLLVDVAPNEGEEVIETEWNTTSTTRMWMIGAAASRPCAQDNASMNGSRRDENYIIHEYVFRNISPEIKAAGRTVVDTLLGFRLLVNYGLHVNSRSWTVLFRL